MDVKFDTWNAEALCKTGALNILIPQLKKYYIRLWAGRVVRLEKYPIQNKVLQQTFHIKRRVGNSRKKWEDGAIENAVAFLGTWPLKPKNHRYRILEAAH